MKKITKVSPSKINLTLDILGKEGDYHLVRSIIFPCYDLTDTLTFSKTAEAGIGVTCKGKFGAVLKKVDKNIIIVAAELFFSAAKIAPQISIDVEKNIPLATGLGGGSSNAATTLLALNALHDSPLSPRKIKAIAIKLGMDVPFFLHPVPSLATHFGEKITPIKRKIAKLPSFTLRYPRAKKLSTKSQYEKLNLALCGKKIFSTTKLLALLRSSRKSRDPSWSALLHNDFEQLYSQPQKKSLYLTGSGPTMYRING